MTDALSVLPEDVVKLVTVSFLSANRSVIVLIGDIARN